MASSFRLILKGSPDIAVEQSHKKHLYILVRESKHYFDHRCGQLVALRRLEEHGLGNILYFRSGGSNSN